MIGQTSDFEQTSTERTTGFALSLFLCVAAFGIEFITLSQVVENGVFIQGAPPHFLMLIGAAAASQSASDWLLRHGLISAGTLAAAIAVTQSWAVFGAAGFLCLVSLAPAWVVRSVSQNAATSGSSFATYVKLTLGTFALAFVAHAALEILVPQAYGADSTKLLLAGLCVAPVAVFMPIMVNVIRARPNNLTPRRRTRVGFLVAPRERYVAAFKYLAAALIGVGMGRLLDVATSAPVAIIGWLSVIIILLIWFTRRFDETCPTSLVTFCMSVSVGHTLSGFSHPDFLLAIFVIAAGRSFHDFDRLFRAQIQGRARRLAERVAQDAELAATASELKAKAYEAAIANLTHDLKSPAATMFGLLELASERVEKTSPIGLDLRMAKSQSKRLLGLVDDVLDLTREEMGQAKPIPTQMDPNTLLADLTKQYRLTADLKGLDLHFANHLELATIVIDARRLERIVSNLLDNATKYTNNGEVRLTASNTPIENGQSTLCIEVADTGIGIPAEQLDTIFSKFNRAGNHYAIDGLGLGLALVSRFTDLLSGELKLESTENKGTTFTIKIPCEVVVDIWDNQDPNAQQVPKDARPSVLIVDDDPISLRLTTSVLSGFARTTECVNGADAVAALSSKHFDYVLMDCRMPGMNGVQATKEIRVDEATAKATPTRIIGLTANASLEEEAMAISAGMNAVLEKPLTLAKAKEILAP